MHKLIGSLQASGVARQSARWIGPATGGGIHNTGHLWLGDREAFIKFAEPAARTRFQTESTALTTLAETDTLRVPGVIHQGHDHAFSWLILEHLNLHRQGDAEHFGRSLAALHQCTSKQYGFELENFIGFTPQTNPWLEDWARFWWCARIQPQLDLAMGNHHLPELEELYETLSHSIRLKLQARQPVPSLLHGDLWAGNHGYLGDGTPVLFDPASYYGDRETDLAMMKLFGGFDQKVFDHYLADWPLTPGHEDRLAIYQLYHLLNHLNLMGTGWLGRCINTCHAILA